MPDSPHLAIELLSRREVFRNSRFAVYSDHILSADGVEIEDYLSVLPFSTSPCGITGVAILPIIEENLVFIRTVRHPMGIERLEIPRGFVDAGESPLEAASRELLEETGLLVDPHSLIPLGTLSPEPAMIRGMIAIFLAKSCVFQKTALEQRELGHIGFEILTLSDAEHVLDRNEFGDPATIIAFLKYMRISQSHLSL